MVLVICCVIVKFLLFNCRLMVLLVLNWVGNLCLIIVLLVMCLLLSWLICMLLLFVEVFMLLIRILFCVRVYIWLFIFFNGVINNVLLCRFLVFFIEEMMILIVCFCCVKGGYDVVIIIVVMFFNCMLVLVGIVIFSCDSMLFSVWVVNGVWVVWLFVLFSLIISL